MTRKKPQKERFPVGRLAISKQGRDKDRVYVIIGSDADHVYAADGEKWTAAAPKKKNRKHLQPVNRMAQADTETGVPDNETIIQAIMAFAGRD